MKYGFFRKINNTNSKNYLVRKREKTQVTNIRNEEGSTTASQHILKEKKWKELVIYADNFMKNLILWTKTLKKQLLPKLTEES